MKRNKINSRELFFQLVLHVIVFLLYAYSKFDNTIEPYEIAFFLNYALAAIGINYFLLPRFLYRKKFAIFFISFFIILCISILLEEFVLERIYFPDTRGKRFLGFFSSLIDVLPTVVLLSGFKFAWDALHKQKELENLQHLLKESELQFLKSQINPHFLFNNLNNLYAHALESSSKTPDIILELSSVLRYMLYDCRAKYVSLHKEVEQLENFVKLNRLQIEGRGKVTFQYENLSHNYKIAPLILSVFIENAFKHSASSQTEDIMISITLSVDESSCLHFSCKNTYLEVSNTNNLSHGIGLENVKKRLDILYPNSHKLNIIQTEKKYEVNLDINLK